MSSGCKSHYFSNHNEVHNDFFLFNFSLLSSARSFGCLINLRILNLFPVGCECCFLSHIFLHVNIFGNPAKIVD